MLTRFGREQTGGVPLAFGLALPLLLGAVAFAPRRPLVGELLLLAVFLPPACGAIRMIPWWFFVALPVIAAQLAAAHHALLQHVAALVLAAARLGKTRLIDNVEVPAIKAAAN